MKRSPLQLEWIRYADVSFKALAGDDDTDSFVRVNLTRAIVRFSESGRHAAMLRIENANEATALGYKFHVEVVASFGLDVEVARAEYRQPDTAALVPVVAVNMSRILFAGARDFLSLLTSRSPGPALMLESVLLEPKDISIVSELEPPEILSHVFGASEEEVEQFRQHWLSSGSGQAVEENPSNRSPRLSSRPQGK
jgi:hypothetical protein